MIRNTFVFFLLLALLLITIQAASAAVVINEFMANPAVAEPDGEWIELFNNGTGAVDLTGYTISDGEDLFTFGATNISSGEFIVLAYNRTQFASAHSVPASTQVVEYGTTVSNLQLLNTGDNIVLNDSTGVLVDSVTYASTTDGKTIGREVDGTGIPAPLVQVTPGKANTLPDITVTSFSAPSTISYVHSFPAKVNVTVKNEGIANVTGQFTIELKACDINYANCNSRATTAINALAVGESKTVALNYAIQLADVRNNAYFLKVTADSTNAVIEVNEMNTATTTGSVSNFPLVMTLLGCTPNPANLTDVVTCSSEVVSGNGEIDSVTANVTLPNGTIADQTVTSSTNRYSFTMIAAQRGNHAVSWHATHINGFSAAGTASFAVVNRAPRLKPGVSVPNQSVDEDTNITLDMSTFFEDLDGDALTFAVVGLPAGFTADIDNATATIKPASEFSGNVTMHFTATDGLSTAVSSNDVVLEYRAVNDVPVLSQFPLVTFDEDSFDASLDLDTLVTDNDAGSVVTWRITATDLDIPISLQVLTGNVAKFSTNADKCGASSAVLQASDGTNKVNQVVQFNVTCLPDAPDFFLDEPVNNSVQNDSTVDFEFTVVDADSNEGLLVEFFHGNTTTPPLEQNFTIRGTPLGIDENVDITLSGLEDGQTYYWYVQISDGAIDATSSLFQYTVEVNDDPVINTHSPQDNVVELEEGDTQEFNVSASDDNSVITFNWTLDGSAVSTTTRFTYSPDFDDVGTHTLAVTVTDDAQQTATHSWMVNVSVVNTAPDINGTIPSITLTEDLPGTINLKAFESDRENVDAELVWGHEGADANLLAVTIDQQTDIATITPKEDKSGTDTVTFILFDPEGLSDRQDVLVTVNAANDAPRILSREPAARDVAIEEGKSLNFSISAQDPEGSTLSYQWTLDGTVVGSRSTFTLNAGSNAAGSHNVAVSARDLQGASTVASWNVTVTHVNILPVIVGTIPDQTLHEDGSAVTLDLTQFERDAEDSGEGLKWSVENVDSPAIVTFAVELPTDSISITPVPDKSGTDTVTFVLTDSAGGRATQDVRITVDGTNDAPQITAVEPSTGTLRLGNGVTQRFNATASDPDGTQPTVEWFVNGISSGTGAQFAFAKNDAGSYAVTVKASDSIETVERSWTVVVATHPFLSPFDGQTSDVSSLTEAQLGAVSNFTLEKSASARVEFVDAVDLRDAVDVAEFTVFEPGVAGIDSGSLTGFGNRKARITLFNVNLNNPVILFTTALTSNKNDITSPCTFCRVVSNANNRVVFEADHFTTFTATEAQPTQLTVPASIDFGEVNRETEVKKAFTLSNAGTQQPLENVVVAAGQNSYNLTFSKDGVNFVPELTVGSIAAQQTVTLTARINVPDDADSGEKDFADAIVRATGVTKTISDIKANPKSLLSFKKVKVGSDTLSEGGRADIKPGESVDVEVTLENLLEDVDIEDITVELTIFDIDDGDDIDEESDEFDVKGDDTEKDTISVSIPLLLEDESYKILLEAEGVDEHGARHRAVLEGELDADKKKHELKLEARVFPTEVSCTRTPTISARVVNLGKEDEEDVIVTASSAELGVSEESTAVDVDEAEDHSTTFNLNLNGARIGTYNLEVKAFRDEDDLEATQTVPIAVKECQEVQSRVTDVTEQQIGQEQQELINRLLAQQQQQPSVAVRESDDGMLWMVLAIVVVLNVGLLVFIVGALMIKRKRK
ncbi:tandem-95 repeat protein, partial [Candidatus Woesearchaeota archaeon]|nr:tandem-95 repeat protein [Candidatus Woesearchaeota archaeon]